MTAFLIIAAAMAAAAAAWILWPLLRPRAAHSVEHAAANVSIFKDQFADLDADLARGTISAEQHAESKNELERRLLDEVRAAPTAGSAQERSNHRWAAVSVALIVPIAAAALYWQIGAPEAFSPLAAKADDTPLSREQIEAMVAQVKERLDKDPNNAEGWTILARTQYALRNFSEAVAAYEKLTALVPENADLLADYADALAMSQGRNFAGQPMMLVQRALTIDPAQWKALAMAGSEAFERKDYVTAADYWQRLQNAAPPGSPVAQQIQGSINEARQLAGLPLSQPGKSEAAGQDDGRSISGTVDLSPSLQSKVKPDDAVFVFARPADGSRMPVAVVRAKVSDLPLKFTLDDSRAMAGAKISTLAEVIVGARISRTGNAISASGDLEGTPEKVKVGSQGIAVSIDRAVP